jgi:hypothetical protein
LFTNSKFKNFERSQTWLNSFSFSYIHPFLSWVFSVTHVYSSFSLALFASLCCCCCCFHFLVFILVQRSLGFELDTIFKKYVQMDELIVHSQFNFLVVCLLLQFPQNSTTNILIFYQIVHLSSTETLFLKMDNHFASFRVCVSFQMNVLFCCFIDFNTIE